MCPKAADPPTWSRPGELIQALKALYLHLGMGSGCGALVGLSHIHTHTQRERERERDGHVFNRQLVCLQFRALQFLLDPATQWYRGLILGLENKFNASIHIYYVNFLKNQSRGAFSPFTRWYFSVKRNWKCMS